MPKPSSRPSVRTIPLRAPRLRVARRDDLGDLVQLENDAFDSDRLSPRQWAHHLRSASAEVRVALDAERLIGALVLFFRRGSSLARLYSLAIAAEARGRGIGNALLDAGERIARLRGCTRLRLEVRRDNRSAQRLYARRGYRVIGTIAGYYEDGEDALRFEKSLGAA
jgi:ribosomal protein S18 acetylase RimI-like enzyme